MIIECNVYPKVIFGNSYTLPASIKEDLEIVLDYFNGRWTDDDLRRYAENTPFELLGDNAVDERLNFLYDLHTEIENQVRMVIPTYTNNETVYAWFDHRYLFIIEIIGRSYVPEHLCDTFGLSDNQSVSGHVSFPEGTDYSYSLLHRDE